MPETKRTVIGIRNIGEVWVHDVKADLPEDAATMAREMVDEKLDTVIVLDRVVNVSLVEGPS